MRGAVTQALQRYLNQHTRSPMNPAAHLQLEAVCRAAAKMAHRKRILLAHTEQVTDPTSRGHMMRLIYYQAVHDPAVHQPTQQLTHAHHLRPQAFKTPPERPGRAVTTGPPHHKQL